MIRVNWIDGFREPKAKPNPAYPNGVDLDMTRGVAPFCQTKLPYPAPRCGQFTVICDVCGMSAVITTAGRPDDPRSVKLACKIQAVKWQ
jgi:hypothetical protein